MSKIHLTVIVTGENNGGNQTPIKVKGLSLDNEYSLISGKIRERKNPRACETRVDLVFVAPGASCVLAASSVREDFTRSLCFSFFLFVFAKIRDYTQSRLSPIEVQDKNPCSMES